MKLGSKTLWEPNVAKSPSSRSLIICRAQSHILRQFWPADSIGPIAWALMFVSGFVVALMIFLNCAYLGTHLVLFVPQPILYLEVCLVPSRSAFLFVRFANLGLMSHAHRDGNRSYAAAGGSAPDRDLDRALAVRGGGNNFGRSYTAGNNTFGDRGRFDQPQRRAYSSPPKKSGKSGGSKKKKKRASSSSSSSSDSLIKRNKKREKLKRKMLTLSPGYKAYREDISAAETDAVAARQSQNIVLALGDAGLLNRAPAPAVDFSTAAKAAGWTPPGSSGSPYAGQGMPGGGASPFGANPLGATSFPTFPPAPPPYGAPAPGAAVLSTAHKEIFETWTGNILKDDSDSGASDALKLALKKRGTVDAVHAFAERRGKVKAMPKSLAERATWAVALLKTI
jgi:hypothetical protein